MAVVAFQCDAGELKDQTPTGFHSHIHIVYGYIHIRIWISIFEYGYAMRIWIYPYSNMDMKKVCPMHYPSRYKYFQNTKPRLVGAMMGEGGMREVLMLHSDSSALGEVDFGIEDW